MYWHRAAFPVAFIDHACGMLRRNGACYIINSEYSYDNCVVGFKHPSN